MKIMVDEDGSLVIGEVFSGAYIQTVEGNRIGFCLRDDTIEFNVLPVGGGSRWFRVNMIEFKVEAMDDTIGYEDLTPGEVQAMNEREWLTKKEMQLLTGCSPSGMHSQDEVQAIIQAQNKLARLFTQEPASEREVPKLTDLAVSPETLREKILSDPDLPCEAGALALIEYPPGAYCSKIRDGKECRVITWSDGTCPMCDVEPSTTKGEQEKRERILTNLMVSVPPEDKITDRAFPRLYPFQWELIVDRILALLSEPTDKED